jgi:hypothetical protein
MSSLAIKGNGLQSELLWAAVIALGALSLGSSRSAEARASTRHGATVRCPKPDVGRGG